MGSRIASHSFRPVTVRTDEHEPVEPLSFGADDKLYAFCWHRAELTNFAHPVFHQGRPERIYGLVRVNVSLPSGRKGIEHAALFAVVIKVALKVLHADVDEHIDLQFRELPDDVER